LLAAINRIAKLVGLASVLVSGEAVWPRPAFRKRLPSRYESAFEIRQFASYFKVPSDKMPHLKAILPEFAAKTRNETGNLFYEFTINGDEVFCREGYVNAEALLAHLENVGAMLAQALVMADLIRIEVHGPAAELAKLKEPLAHLKPAWFELHS
jgi:quinol monooxygenase YgiN